MKKYTKERLAARIAELANFEDSKVINLDDKQIDFNGCSFNMFGLIYSRKKLSGGLEFDEIYLTAAWLTFEDGSETMFTPDELKDLERLVKMWI